MAQSRNGMMSSAPNLVQALRPGGVEAAMQPVQMIERNYNPEAAAKFQAAMQANRAQRPQMGQQQTSGLLQQFGQPLPQDIKMIRDVTAGPGASMPQFVRNQGMRNPPFYNPPPGQNMQMQGGMGQNMIDNNAFQGNFQEFLAGRGQGNVPPEAFQNYFQQQSQQSQPQAQRSGANAGRVRQSPGVYKDPNTGALYGNDGKLMRAGTRRMR